MTGSRLVDTSEDVVSLVWRHLAKAGQVRGDRVPVQILAALAPLVEELLRERIGSVGDLRGEVID